MKRFLLPLAGLLAAGLLAMVAAPGAEAGQCHCRSQSAMGTNQSFSYQSGPPGICSVAQDVQMCATNQIQVGRGWSPERVLGGRRGDDLSAALRSAGVALAPGDALQVAALTPPEEYGDRLPDVLTTILGLSLTRQPERLAELHAAFERHTDTILPPFTTLRGQETIRLGDYEAVVSYGCIEVSRGSFFARARTPFASSRIACEGTKT